MTARRRGLGRGLDALIRPPEAEIRTLGVDSLRPNRYQPRRDFDDAELAELAASIEKQGMVQPIVVTPEDDGAFLIVAGERRWRAAQRAGLEQVPVVVRQVDDERELLELALVENLQRSDLNPVEEAEAYRALGDRFGLSQQEIATQVGKGRSTVANALRLLDLPEAVLDLLRSGELSAGHARPLLALDDSAEQLRLAREASAEGLTAREIEAKTRRQKAGSGGARSPAREEPHAAAAAEKLTRHLQTKVEILRRGTGGVMKIHFHSEEALIRIYDHLMRRLGG